MKCIVICFWAISLNVILLICYMSVVKSTTMLHKCPRSTLTWPSHHLFMHVECTSMQYRSSKAMKFQLLKLYQPNYDHTHCSGLFSNLHIYIHACNFNPLGKCSLHTTHACSSVSCSKFVNKGSSRKEWASRSGTLQLLLTDLLQWQQLLPPTDWIASQPQQMTQYGKKWRFR